MYKFAGYTIQVNGALHHQLFKTRVQAEQVCQQNNLDMAAVVQLFRFARLLPDPGSAVEPVAET